MHQAIDRKYGEVVAQHAKFLPGEPVFVLRAQDALTKEVILEYAALCEYRGCDQKFIKEVRAAAKTFEDWQNANPTLVKIPD